MQRKKPAVQQNFGKTAAQAAETLERHFPGIREHVEFPAVQEATLLLDGKPPTE